MNIQIYLEERKEMNINEYEYIRPKIFEYIRMSEYSIHTDCESHFAMSLSKSKSGDDHKPHFIVQNIPVKYLDFK